MNKIIIIIKKDLKKSVDYSMIIMYRKGLYYLF